MKKLLWENKIWALWTCPSCKCCPARISKAFFMLEKKTAGFCDYPVKQYRGIDSYVAYDMPERIPKYVRKQVEKFLLK